MTNATPSIFDVLTHTPIWVWAIFLFILVMGYQRTRDRVLPLWRLLLLPAIMALLAISGLAGAGLASLPAILVGIAIGGVSGWLLERDGATRRLPDGRVWLRGEWWSLAQVIVIFGLHYATAIVAATSPALAADSTWHLVTTFASSLLSAMLLARAAARLRAYLTAVPAAI